MVERRWKVEIERRIAVGGRVQVGNDIDCCMDDIAS